MPRPLEVGDDRVVLGDKLDDFHPEVRKRASEPADPVTGEGGELVVCELVEWLGVPLVHDVVYQAAEQLLVRFGLRARPLDRGRSAEERLGARITAASLGVRAVSQLC